MSDLLQPEDVRAMRHRATWEEVTARQRQPVARLCRDYLTLWERLAEKASVTEVCDTCGGMRMVALEEGAPDTIVATMPCPNCAETKK